MTYKHVLNKLVETHQAILGTNLVGIYLHGSYVMQSFNPKISDLDFLVVVHKNPSNEEKFRLVDAIINLNHLAPAKGFEMSMMTLDETLKPKKPTPYRLHYSSFHLERYQENPNYLCQGDDDPDLPTHLTVIKARGQCLCGQPISQIFGEVDSGLYLEAIMYDLNEAHEGIRDNMSYYVLNICRSLMYLRTGTIASKLEGGKWKPLIIYHLEYHPVIRFGEFKRLIPNINERVLMRQLRELEDHGIIHREDFNENPPRVEYALTEVGKSVSPIIAQLGEWGKKYNQRFAYGTIDFDYAYGDDC